MPLPQPFRGEVWGVDFPDFGRHPAVVLSVDAPSSRLGHIAVAPVTGTPGPAARHIALTACAGPARCDQPYADLTALQPVDRAALVRQGCRLGPSEVDRLAAQLRIHSGL